MKKEGKGKLNKDLLPLIGKVSVLHYLNTKLKPLPSEAGDKYPVYLRLGFNRKQTAIKSQFFLFYQDGDHPVVPNEIYQGEFLDEEMGYLTIEQFDRASKKISQAYRREEEAIVNIFRFFGSHGINLITQNTADIIEVLIWTIEQTLDNYLKHHFYKDMMKSHFELASILDTDEAPFDWLFKVLTQYGNSDLKLWLGGHKDKHNAIVFLFTNVTNTNGYLRILDYFLGYRESLPILKEIPESQISLNFIRASVLYHFENHLHSSNPDILKILKKEVEKIV